MPRRARTPAQDTHLLLAKLARHDLPTARRARLLFVEPTFPRGLRRKSLHTRPTCLRCPALARYDAPMAPEPAEAEVPTKADLSASVPTRGGAITVAELHRRCAILERGIVLYHEIPDGTPETFEVMLERVYELGAQFECFAIV